MKPSLLCLEWDIAVASSGVSSASIAGRPPTLDMPCCLQWQHTVLPEERQKRPLERCKKLVGMDVVGINSVYIQ